MQNKFGLKDFVLLAVMVIVGLSVWLGMYQRDGQKNDMQTALSKLTKLEGQLARLEATIEAGGGVAAAPVGGPRAEPGVRDQNWARPDVAVQWQPAMAFAHDPRADAKFLPGGEFTEIYEAQLARLTPYISADVYGRRIQELTMGSLAIYDPETLEMRGQVAEAWQVDPGGLWLRARIRANAKFSDGQPITAEDLRWTFHDFVMNEQIEAERTRSILRDSIKSVTVIDDRTVEFAFQQRLFTNVDNALSLFILPKHVYGALNPAQINRGTGLLVGAGPYRLKDFDVNRQWAPPADVVLERNEQYWGPKPAMDALRIRAVNEEIARLNAFKKGDADMITPAAPQFVAMRQDPNWQSRAHYLNWVNMRSGYSFIAWNCGMRNGKPTPFTDKRVRLAMTQLLDREKMIRDIWRGIGEVAKGNMPLISAGSNKDIKPWPYEPQRALALLKEAGWEDRNGDGVLESREGVPFQFEYSYASGSEISEKIARFVVDACSAQGIRVTLRPADWSVYQEFMKTRDFDAITLGWGASAPESDPRQIFHSDSIKNQGDNFAQWANEDADRLIDEGRREMDAAKRAKIWQQLEAVLHEDQPYTFIRVPPWLRIVNIEIGNVHTYPKWFEHPEFFRGSWVSPTPAN